LGGRKGIRPVKNWVVGCWRGYLSGARCRLAYGPADATATHSLSLVPVKSRLVLPFWYWLTRVVPDKRPLNGCVCVFRSLFLRCLLLQLPLHITTYSNLLSNIAITVIVIINDTATWVNLLQGNVNKENNNNNFKVINLSQRQFDADDIVNRGHYQTVTTTIRQWKKTDYHMTHNNDATAADSAPNVWLLSHITQCPSIDHVFTFWQKLPTCICRFFCQDTKPSKIGSYFRDMIRYDTWCYFNVSSKRAHGNEN